MGRGHGTGWGGDRQPQIGLRAEVMLLCGEWGHGDVPGATVVLWGHVGCPQASGHAPQVARGTVPPCQGEQSPRLCWGQAGRKKKKLTEAGSV